MADDIKTLKNLNNNGILSQKIWISYNNNMVILKIKISFDNHLILFFTLELKIKEIEKRNGR